MPRTQKLIRWTIEHAAVEFGIDRATLSKRIKNAGILPGDDSRFSTTQICSAVFTDGETARAFLALSQKENFDLRNKKLAGELVEAKQCQQLWDAAMITMRQKISDAPIPDAVKHDLVRELQSIPIEEYKTTKNENDSDSGPSEQD